MFIFYKQSGNTEIAHIGVNHLKLWLTNGHGKSSLTKMKIRVKYLAKVINLVY